MRVLSPHPAVAGPIRPTGRGSSVCDRAHAIARRRTEVDPAAADGKKLHPAAGDAVQDKPPLSLRRGEFEKGMDLALKMPTDASPNATGRVEKERQERGLGIVEHP